MLTVPEVVTASGLKGSKRRPSGFCESLSVRFSAAVPASGGLGLSWPMANAPLDSNVSAIVRPSVLRSGVMATLERERIFGRASLADSLAEVRPHPRREAEAQERTTSR